MWFYPAFKLTPHDFIRVAGEEEWLCGILIREQAVRYHWGEYEVQMQIQIQIQIVSQKEINEMSPMIESNLIP